MNQWTTRYKGEKQKEAFVHELDLIDHYNSISLTVSQWNYFLSFTLHRLRQEKEKSTSVCSTTSLKRPCQKRYDFRWTVNLQTRLCSEFLWIHRGLLSLSSQVPWCSDHPSEADLSGLQGQLLAG